MKKFYATLCVAALAAGSMFAQTPALTTVWTKTYDVEVGAFDEEAPDWNNPSAIKTQPGMKNATGLNGKLYGIDMRTMSVTAFDENGYSKAYDLPSLAGQTISYTALDNAGDLTTAPDFYGSLITRDDAGNLLIGHGEGTGAACNTWTVLDTKTGATKRLVADFGGHYRALLPQYVVGRALGDVTKEGYLYVAPTSIFWPTILGFAWRSNHLEIQLAKMLTFKGDGTVAGTDVTGQVSGPMGLGAWFTNTTSPWYASVEAMKDAIANDAEVGMDQTFFLYSKAPGQAVSSSTYAATVGILTYGQEYKTTEPFPTTSSDLTGYNYTEYSGFDTFEVGGERYYVVCFNGEEEFKNDGIVEFTIVDSEGYLIDEATWTYEGEWTDEGVNSERDDYFTPEGSMCLNIEKVDEDNVNIYMFAQAPGQGVVAGMFNFGNGNTQPGAVDEVSVDADVAPVYYNLNGIRVANPANGIFIEKRGAKVTKVIK